VANLRPEESIRPLGEMAEGSLCWNDLNFPKNDVAEAAADLVFEISNPLPFRGATYITRSWAERSAADPSLIAIPPPPPVSLHEVCASQRPSTPSSTDAEILIARLPRPLQLALATTATDPRDLIALVRVSCDLLMDSASDLPRGLRFSADSNGRPRPVIHDHTLFDAVANNPHLPDVFKEAMVLRPGIQGESEIVGEWRSPDSHVFEYLRRNSYIPWGHFAANMADDAIRYDVGKLTPEDIHGLRHLYYQRTYVTLAESLALEKIPRSRLLSEEELEVLRLAILKRIAGDPEAPPFTATLWGWNYGYGYAPCGYRLHASHQQIHQQHALIPAAIPPEEGATAFVPYACGDLVQLCCVEFRRHHQRGFFDSYVAAIRNNRRLDGRAELNADLVVHEDEWAMLFVPKAQTSQWELQIIPQKTVGNILEADSATRRALNLALLNGMRTLASMGAAMITVIEMSKRFDCHDSDQRLLYALLPKLPESPGAFSEAQLRWICGHYPEDFARACRAKLIGL
jgi:hypothetical protein